MSEIAVIPVGQLTLFDLATIANEEHALAQQAFASTLEHAWRAGKALVEAKRRQRHGAWLPWLVANFDGSKRTAQVYMQIANAQTSAYLDESSIVKALAAIRCSQASGSLAESNPSSERTAMDKWVARFESRDDMAEEYAALLRRAPADSGIWPVLNLAIVDRWSESGLAYIKRKAWGSR